MASSSRFGTFTHTCTAPRGMVVGNCHLQRMLHSPWGRSPVSFEQIGQIQFFRGSRVKGPSSLALLKMVSHQWPVALLVIWHIYSCLPCSLEDSARNLSSSGKVVLGQGQVPCEFWADRPNFIFQPVAPDVIWHIYSYLYCSSRDGGRDLPSAGDVALPWGRSPVSFEQISQPSFFSRWLLTWFGTFTCTCTAPQGMVAGTCHLQGRHTLPWGRSPVNFEQIGQPSFFSWWLLMWFGTFTCTSSG